MAKFAILRTGKLKSAASVRGMLKHNFRDIETPNAEAEKTDLNEHLAATSTEDGMRRYRSLLPDKIRKNAVHAIDYMITTSPGASDEAKQACLKEAHEWLAEKHGAENIIMASKHLDETTPHIHILVVPLKDKKLNCSHFLAGSKHRMNDLQDEFYARLKSKNIDLDRGLKGSKAKHESIKSWNAKKQLAEKLTAEKLETKIAESIQPRKTGTFSKETKDEAVSRTLSTVKKLLVSALGANQSLSEEKQSQANTSKSLSNQLEDSRQINKAIATGDMDFMRKAVEKTLKKKKKNEAIKLKKSNSKGL